MIDIIITDISVNVLSGCNGCKTVFFRDNCRILWFFFFSESIDHLPLLLATVAEIHRLLIKTVCPFKACAFSFFLCNSRELQTNNVTCEITFLPAQIPQELTQLCYIHDVSIIIYIICRICSPVIPKFPYKFIQPWQHCSSSCQVLFSGGVSRCYKIPIFMLYL